MNQPAEKINRMEGIELRARFFAKVRGLLADASRDAERELQAVRDKHAKKLRGLLGSAAEAKSVLLAAIENSRDLFDKPRTRVVDGIRFGLRKKTGKVEIADERRTIKRIRELLPEEQAELLIRIREEVDRNAVKDLVGGDLKRLGIQIVADSDEPVIKPVDPDVDKLIADATRGLEVKK